jgi:hypothetical protein
MSVVGGVVMDQKPNSRSVHDVDGLRLFALGRIPRCTDCPRYRALVRAHSSGAFRVAMLPTVPDGCAHQVCAPLVDRYAGRLHADPGLGIVACGP